MRVAIITERTLNPYLKVGHNKLVNEDQEPP